jgi:hypothetical protein
MSHRSELDRLRAKLITLSAIRIGMSNAQQVMREYQELMLGVIDVLREMASEDTPSSPEA